MAPSTKKRKTKVSMKENDEITEFENLLVEIGVEFQEIENGIQLSNDVVTIQEKLSKAFKIHIDQDLLVQEAELFFKKEFENDDKLTLYLSPVLLSKFHGTNTSAMNDSFVRVLLCIPQIQKPLINSMLEKLTQLDNKQSHGTSMLLLKQLCWLPSLIDAELLAEHYSKLMVQVSKELSSCMLSYLPCIFPEPCPLSLKNTLVGMLETHMSTALIDCLDSIDSPTDSLDKLIERMKPALNTQYLPMCLLFLLNRSSDVSLVIEEAKERVTLESFKGGEECWMLLIDKLKVLLLTNKSIAIAWIQNIERSGNVGVVDWVVMLLLHTENTHDLRLKVEKLAMSVAPRLDVSFIASFFQFFPRIFESLFTGLTRFAYMWMKKHQKLSECLYVNAFTHLSCYFKQEIVAELVGQVCGGCHCDQALNTLLHLTLHHTSSVNPYASFLNAMLDSVERLSVEQVKNLYQILSILTFSTTSKNSAKQDGFFILIKKQLSSGILKYQQLGIVGGLMSLKSLSLQTDDAKKTLKQSIDIITMLEESATKKTPLLAFYYEELATLSRSFSQDLQEWLLNKVMENFQNNYVLDVPTEDGQSSSKNDTCIQHCLDDEAEIAVNLVFNEHSPVCCSVICLNSCFRLLHTLHNCCHDDIADIEALLGCGVKTVGTNSDKQTLITSTLLKINFFRELLNAFGKEADSRVVSRLQDVVEMQEAVLQLITEYPEYKPLGLTRASVVEGDQVFVLHEVKKKKKRRKATKSKGGKQKKSVEEDDEDVEDNEDDDGDSTRVVLEKKDIKLSVLLRALDECVVRMLSYCSLDSAEDMHKVSIRCLHLLLKELNTTAASPDKEDLIDLLEHLCRLAKQVVTVLQDTSCDSMDDMENWKVASDCFILIINTVSLFIRKEGKEKATQNMKLKCDSYDFFNKLAIDLFALQSSTSSFSIQMPVDMMTLLSLLDSPTTSPDTCDMAMSCLRHSWTDDNEKVTKDSIPKLLCLAGVKSMNELIEEMRVDLQDTSLPTLNRTTWTIFYKGLLQDVVKLTKAITPQTPSLESLERWNELVGYFHDLILLLKKQHNNSNLGSALKFGQQFISEFLKHCMPLIDQLLTSHKQQVQAILKSLQPATRVLQHLCTHTKIEKQTALTQRVPAMKKVLEAFVQRVKQTLRLNCCLNAFWLGNLKHRNLKGDEILSQAPTKMADDDEDVEEEDDENNDKENEEIDKNKVRNYESDRSDDESEVAQDEDSADVDYLFKESSDSENNEEQDKQKTKRPSVDNTVMSLAF